MDLINSEAVEVAIVKGETPKETLLNGIEKLGGISKYINNGDQVFIKFNLILPSGFPTNTNFDILEILIQACNKAGAKKVYLGSFPFKGVTIKAISDILGLKKHFESLKGELAFLDNSNYFYMKGFNSKKLKVIKNRSFSRVNVNNKTFIIPKVILDSDKFISVNQVNVDPLFKCRLSLLNSYSIVPNKYQEIKNPQRHNQEYLLNDKYKQDLTSNILDVFSIKKPNLVINDLFYVLEAAGPVIYKDSNLTKTGIMVLGNDTVAVDAVTSKIMNLNIKNPDLISRAEEEGLGLADISKIKIIGENVKNIDLIIKECASKLDETKLQNFSIKTGNLCSGCFKQAYHLLNLMKTNMTKDLKYITPNNSFLIGDDPPDPNNIGKDNIILFGDCAINSTRKKEFKIIVKESKKKRKYKVNKKVLKLSGCPPDIFKCIKLLLNYYGKRDLPMLNLYSKTVASYTPEKITKKLRIWEVG
ncbi:MAG: DUF362 domain-containing protein [Promethearchaeota archaeon]|nr:MAG: DUF362 domain-containing protein [Candidatus Lokiarchaeota archaeon]